jgi:Prealbumin-like fold domain
MSRTLITGLVLTVLAVAALDTPLRAQEPQGNGNLIGVVTDSNDKPMTGFAVKFYQSQPRGIDQPGSRRNLIDQPASSELAEKLITTVTTDAQGKFSAPNLKSGVYLLKGGSKNIGFLYREEIVEPGKTTDVGRIKLVKT